MTAPLPGPDSGPGSAARPRRVAFLFPGQGTKRVHETLRFVARAAADSVLLETARARCEEAARAAGVQLDHLLRRPSLLDETEVLQPVLTAVCLAIAECLSRHGITPNIVLGLSAGEIPALAAAGGVSIEQAISLAALRGRLMARQAARHPGAMAALATSDPAVVERALAIGREAGALEIAAQNGPDETVLTGDVAAVTRMMRQSEVPTTRIPTPGAWHSAAMEGALSEWRAALDETSISPLRAEMVANRTGALVPSSPDAPSAIRALLAEQLVRPVEFRRALFTVRERCDAVVMVGPGAVLRALWYRNLEGADWTGLAGLHVPNRPDAARPPQKENNHPDTTSGARHDEPSPAAVPGVTPAARNDEPSPVANRRMEGARDKHAHLFDTEDERSLRATIAALGGHA
ncbi:MAG: acyltransferase domain-containing protein [Polyangiaceae bacterium]